MYPAQTTQAVLSNIFNTEILSEVKKTLPTLAESAAMKFYTNFINNKVEKLPQLFNGKSDFLSRFPGLWEAKPERIFIPKSSVETQYMHDITLGYTVPTKQLESISQSILEKTVERQELESSAKEDNEPPELFIKTLEEIHATAQKIYADNNIIKKIKDKIAQIEEAKKTEIAAYQATIKQPTATGRPRSTRATGALKTSENPQGFLAAASPQVTSLPQVTSFTQPSLPATALKSAITIGSKRG